MTGSIEQVSNLADVRERRPTYVAVGVFDGVHRGHQHLLQKMVTAAHSAGARPAVLTFFPHPRVVIQGLSGRLYLTTLEERLRLLGKQGLELIVVHPFNEEVRHMRARTFMEQLRDHLGMRQLWGASFSLGYQREGTTAYLSELGAEMGFTVHELHDMVMWNGERVSSSRVRKELAAGNIKDVNGGLGRPFCVKGEVVEGDKRGRTIGFPTANLAVWDQQLLPANGVYATYAWLDGQRYTAATNVGIRPTVNGSAITVEAHLLDFGDEIYGRALRLEFMEHVRPERKFAGLDALKAQIDADVNAIRDLLEA